MSVVKGRFLTAFHWESSSARPVRRQNWSRVSRMPSPPSTGQNRPSVPPNFKGCHYIPDAILHFTSANRKKQELSRFCAWKSGPPDLCSAGLLLPRQNRFPRRLLQRWFFAVQANPPSFRRKLRDRRPILSCFVFRIPAGAGPGFWRVRRRWRSGRSELFRWRNALTHPPAWPHPGRPDRRSGRTGAADCGGRPCWA